MATKSVTYSHDWHTPQNQPPPSFGPNLPSLTVIDDTIDIEVQDYNNKKRADVSFDARFTSPNGVEQVVKTTNGNCTHKCHGSPTEVFITDFGPNNKHSANVLYALSINQEDSPPFCHQKKQSQRMEPVGFDADMQYLDGIMPSSQNTSDYDFSMFEIDGGFSENSSSSKLSDSQFAKLQRRCGQMDANTDQLCTEVNNLKREFKRKTNCMQRDMATIREALKQEVKQEVKEEVMQEVNEEMQGLKQQLKQMQQIIDQLRGENQSAKRARLN